MSESAIQRKRALKRRIVVAAQELAIAHGYDGFTLDELATAVGVSRRTLFNHVKGKEEAVLGGSPDLDTPLMAEFGRGGPTGNLFDDLVTVVVDVFAREGAEREDGLRFQRLIEANPALMVRVHNEFQRLCEHIVAVAGGRPGADAQANARIAVSLLAGLLALAMTEFVTSDDDRTYIDHLRGVVDSARALIQTSSATTAWPRETT